jgi:hypothetical protein
MAAKPQRPKGVPEEARLVRLESTAFLPTVNALLKPHGMRMRLRASARGGGVPSWAWLEYSRPIPRDGGDEED